MRILVVNDDGIHSPGLYALVRELSKDAEITVVAPAFEKSGASQFITINSILLLEKVYKDNKFFGYSLDGSPADCTKVALSQIMEEAPDYIFSGINLGANISTNVHYSGTVGAASEGAAAGITSCAVSLSTFTEPNFEVPAFIARKWLHMMEENLVPKGILYNINVPAMPLNEIKGFMPTKLANVNFELEYEKRVNPRGNEYFWLSGVEIPSDIGEEENSDIKALKNGYVSVTPMKHQDRTDYNLLDSLKKSDIVKLL